MIMDITFDSDDSRGENLILTLIVFAKYWPLLGWCFGNLQRQVVGMLPEVWTGKELQHLCVGTFGPRTDPAC